MGQFKKECVHNWIEVCTVYHCKQNSEGMALRCSECNVLGFQKSITKAAGSTDSFGLEWTNLKHIQVGDIELVNGMDIFQAEYRVDGRPSPVWDAHL